MEYARSPWKDIYVATDSRTVEEVALECALEESETTESRNASSGLVRAQPRILTQPGSLLIMPKPVK